MRTVALAFKAIGKLTRDKIERESRRARRTCSISSTERTRTNSEVSTTSTIGSSSAERRLTHVPGKHGIDNSSGQRSPHGKKFNKLSTNSSILRHPTSSSAHTSGRHVEFSALSPVPSDGSDSDGKEPAPKESTVEGGISVRADVHGIPPLWTQTELPVWVKRHHKEPVRRCSLPIVNRKQEAIIPSASALENCSKSHSLSELILPAQSLSEPAVLDEPSSEATPAGDQKENRGNTIEDGEMKSNALLQNTLVSEEFASGRSEKNDVTDNFMMDASFLPIESFRKEPVVSPDHVSSSFTKFKGLDFQELTQPLADNNGHLDNPEIVRKAITAVERGQTELVEKYLDAGLSVNAHDAVRRSLLYYSVSLGDVEMSQFLLKR